MTRYECPHCQRFLKAAAPLPAGRKVKCPKCGGVFAVSSVIANPSPPSDPESSQSDPEDDVESTPASNLAAMFNQLTPNGAERLAAALNAGGPATPPQPTNDTEAPTQPEISPMVIGTLGCLLPVALILAMCSGIPILLFEQFSRFLWIGPLLGLVAAFFVVRNMWRQWTTGRAVWTTIVVVCAALVTYFNTAQLYSHHALTPIAEPLITEFRSITDLQRAEGGKLNYGHVFPLVLTPRGSKERSEPVTPQLDFDLYDKLPTEMRVKSPAEEIRTVVLVDWWWNYAATYQNQVTGGRGNAYVGKCTITVVDRKTRRTIAETTLVSAQKPPPRKRTAFDWYGSQPSYDDVVNYLKGLPKQ